jgi:uncharacterized protein (DUF302 family)
MISYGFTKELDRPFEQVVEIVTEALKKGGFGILTTIDVKEKLKEKLGVDFRKYLILGACSPKHAHQALLAEENIGLMLPCNVVVYEKDSKTVVSVVKPTAMMSMLDNEKLAEIGGTVEGLLKQVFDAVT